MGIVVKFFEWLYNLLRSGLSFLVSIPGLIVSAVTAVCSVVASMFGNFTFWNDAISWVNTATEVVHEIVSNDLATPAQIIIRYVALDTLVEVAVSVVSCTVAVCVLVFVTLFLAFVAVVPTVLGVRAVLKAVRIATGGFIEP